MEDRTLPSPIHIHLFHEKLNSRLLGTNVLEQAVHGMLKPCDRPLTDSLYYTRHPRREPHEKSFPPTTTFQHGLIAGGGRSLLFMIKTCFPVEREARTLTSPVVGRFSSCSTALHRLEARSSALCMAWTQNLGVRADALLAPTNLFDRWCENTKPRASFVEPKAQPLQITSPANLVLNTRYIWAKLYKAKLSRMQETFKLRKLYSQTNSWWFKPSFQPFIPNIY